MTGQDDNILVDVVALERRFITEFGSADSALFNAAHTGYPFLARLALAAGANVHAWDDANSQQTPLYIAALSDSCEVVQVLLNAGADKDAMDAKGNTPLIAAAAFGRACVADVLLKAGANREARNAEDQTALIVAAEKGHLDTVQVLLKAGADKDVQDHAKKTAADYARDHGHIDILYLLSPLSFVPVSVKDLSAVFSDMAGIPISQTGGAPLKKIPQAQFHPRRAVLAV